MTGRRPVTDIATVAIAATLTRSGRSIDLTVTDPTTDRWVADYRLRLEARPGDPLVPAVAAELTRRIGADQ